MKSPDVIVIGAGVVGCHIAYLARQARDKSPAPRPGRRPWWHISSDSRSHHVTDAGPGLLPGPCYGQLRPPVPVSFLDVEELRTAEPFLSHKLVGASYCALDEYRNPMLLCRALCRGIARCGELVRLKTPVTGLLRNHDEALGVTTPDGQLSAQDVVLAAGVWSPELAATVGIETPIIPRKGQLLVTEPGARLVDSVISHAVAVPFADFGIPAPEEFSNVTSHKRYLRYLKQVRSGTFAGRFYIGSTSEFRGFDRSSTPEALTALTSYPAEIVPALALVRLLRAWAGLRPRSKDGKFKIGRVPGIPHLYVATGHDSIGIICSAVTGMYLAQTITGGEPTVDMSMFAPGPGV